MHAFRRPIAAALAALAIPAALTACSTSTADTADTADTAQDKPLIVVASATPHGEILEWIDEQDDTFELEISQVSDDAAANGAVANGSADVNFFQHLPYLRDWEDQTGLELVSVADVHIEPMSLYSEKITDIAELPDGATIAIPSSPSNLARALLLLEANGLLELDSDLDPTAVTSIDLTRISANPHNLQFVTVDDALVFHSIKDSKVHGVVASTNYALEAGYDPADDAVLTESPENNPYTNILVASEESQHDPRVQALAKHITSHETAEWIRQQYGNAVVPVTN